MRTHARIFLAQGSADTSVAPASFDVLNAQLVAHGKAVKACLVPGGDHGYHRANDHDPIVGLRDEFGRLAAWWSP